MGKKESKNLQQIQLGKRFLKVVSNRKDRYKPQFATFYLYLINFAIYKSVVIIVSFTMACRFALACESILCQNLNVQVIF